MLHRRIISVFVFLLIGTGIILAGEGDDPKESKKSEDKVIKKDSIVFIEVDRMESDDTLVFEDWDESGGGGTSPIGNNNIADLGTKVIGSKNDVQSNWNSMINNAIKSVTTDRYTVDFSVYPNPTVNTLNIKASIPANTIRVVNIIGNEVKREPYAEQIDVIDLPPGTYFIQLLYLNHTESLKFIKSN